MGGTCIFHVLSLPGDQLKLAGRPCEVREGFCVIATMTKMDRGVSWRKGLLADAGKNQAH